MSLWCHVCVYYVKLLLEKKHIVYNSQHLAKSAYVRDALILCEYGSSLLHTCVPASDSHCHHTKSNDSERQPAVHLANSYIYVMWLVVSLSAL